GIVRASNGFGLRQSRVTADTLQTADLSGESGRYATVLPAGSGRSLFAVHPSMDELGTAIIANLNPGEITSIDITVEPTRPTVTGLTPSDGATDQLVGTNVVVHFSEPLGISSVSSSSLRLELGNAYGEPTGVLVTGGVVLANSGDLVFVPARPLPPGRLFVASFSGEVCDLGGVLYRGGPFSWTFSTAADISSGDIDPDKIHLEIPVDGVSEILGQPGALPAVAPGATPWAVSPSVEGSQDPTSSTCTATVGGGFTCSVGHPPEYPVGIGDTVWLKVFDPAGNEAAHFRIGPFVTQDGKGFVARVGEPTVFTSSDDITVDVPPSAFSVPTLVTVSTLDPSTAGVSQPAGMGLGAYVRVTFEGQASETLRLRVPAPVDAPIGADVFIGDAANLPWGRKVRLRSVGGVIEGSGQRYFSNHASLQPAIPPGATSDKVLDNDEWTCENVRETGLLTGCLIEQLLLELKLEGDMIFFYELSNEFAIGHGYANAVTGHFQAIYNLYADAIFFQPPPWDWDGGYLLPLPVGDPLHIIRRDRATGWILGEEEYDPIQDAGSQFEELGNLYEDRTEPPVLVGARPFDVIRFMVPAPPSGQPWEPREPEHLRLEITAKINANGTVDIASVSEFPLADGTAISVFNIDEPSEPKDLLDDPLRLCNQGGTSWNKSVNPGQNGPDGEAPEQRRKHELLLIVTPGDLDPLGFEEFEFQFDRPLAKDMEDLEPEELAEFFDLGIKRDCGGGPGTKEEPIPISFDLSEDRSRLVITPQTTLLSGHIFKLKLKPEMITVSGESDQAEPIHYHGDAPTRVHFGTQEVRGESIAD
ncbi:MAG: Ig-like domain-containing protein, partial [bacterium]|nr:Ig-like domain-containing protein [bacterium]